MKIVINTEETELFNEFIKVAGSDYQFINGKIENVLFNIIEENNVDAYIISESVYAQKAIDFIKKSNPYIPVLYLRNTTPFKIVVLPKNADIYIDNYIATTKSTFINLILTNIESYIKTFSTLKKLTSKPKNKIEFGPCVYDPTRRLLYHKGKEIKRLSAKEGGILELLALNYKEVVKKEIILEKVWRKTDYFAGRSMDVYITYLRNTFKNNKIKLTIKNISGVGLILE